MKTPFIHKIKHSGKIKPVKDKVNVTIKGQDVLITNVETSEEDLKIEIIIIKFKQGEMISARREIVELAVTNSCFSSPSLIFFFSPTQFH